jgi:uncharacterized sodium:solute symporter family permease YidK
MIFDFKVVFFQILRGYLISDDILILFWQDLCDNLISYLYCRIFVVILVGISVLWIPLIQAAQQGQLFLYIQALTGYIAPPICSVFLLAIFVPRVTENVIFQKYFKVVL